MTYRETLRPPTIAIVVIALLAASFGLIVVPLSLGLAAAIALVLAGIVVIIALASSPRIECEGTQLRAGPAQIDAQFFGEIYPLDREATRAEFGSDADLRAWSLHRSYARGSVRIEIIDPRDPTPFWIVCTNRPEELAAVLQTAARAPQNG